MGEEKHLFLLFYYIFVNMTTLMIIDPQCDFHSGGSLAVPGADEDAIRLAAWIDKHSARIDHIVVTLDTHHKLHIAHASFWRAGHDAEIRPESFTLISAEDIMNGKWLPRDKSLTDYCIK